MEEVFEKIENLLKAFYPVLYLTSFEYERTKQKVRTVIGNISTNNNVYEWNCVDGLKKIEKDTRLEIEDMARIPVICIKWYIVNPGRFSWNKY